MRILIAGVGNVLHADDAFGVEVARRLEKLELPAEVKLVETGIAGIALVQELQEGYDALVVIDAVDRDRPPGTVMLIDPDVIDVGLLTWDEKHDLLADMHLSTPERSLMLARALGVLPSRLLMVGCQPADIESLGEPLSPKVEAAVDIAVGEIVKHVRALIDDAVRSSTVPASTVPASTVPAAPA